MATVFSPTRDGFTGAMRYCRFASPPTFFFLPAATERQFHGYGAGVVKPPAHRPTLSTYLLDNASR